jgi:hypothetical protein
MNWFVVLLLGAGLFALYRIYSSVRKLRDHSNDDWDAKLVEKLRLAGSDPFQPHEVDFFFALPGEAAAAALSRALAAEGCALDLRPAPESVDYPLSLHAVKSVRISVPGMREFSRRFALLAREHGGRYDGWAAGHVARAPVAPSARAAPR